MLRAPEVRIVGPEVRISGPAGWAGGTPAGQAGVEPTAADVLAGGEPDARSRARKRRAAALVGLVVLALGLVAGDRWQRHREFDAIADRTAAGRGSVGYASARVSGMLRYTSPLLTSNAATPELRRSLQEIVQGAAGGQVADVTVDRDRTARTPVLPWHGAQRTARERCVAYLDGRLGYLTAVAADFDALYRTQSGSREQLEAARAALLAAAPDRAGRERVAAALP